MHERNEAPTRRVGMMGGKRELCDSMSIEEATVFSMWEMAAIVGVQSSAYKDLYPEAGNVLPGEVQE